MCLWKTSLDAAGDLNIITKTLTRGKKETNLSKSQKEDSREQRGIWEQRGVTFEDAVLLE